MKTTYSEDPEDNSRGLAYSFTSTSGTTGNVNASWIGDIPSYDYSTYPYVPYPTMTITTSDIKPRCYYCDGKACYKPEMCPRVKKIKYYEDGTVSSVEFHKL